MNNAWLAQQDVDLSLEDSGISQETLAERESEIVKILEAVREVQKTRAWSTLKDYVFKGLAESLLKELTREARRDNPDTLKLARLAGQLQWAERYADLSKFEAEFKAQLSSIKRLHGQT